MAADEEINMDKDRMKGAAKNTTGKMKEAAGKMTGDSKMNTAEESNRLLHNSPVFADRVAIL
jgi:hypothetical protein